jgi:proline racemase
MSNTFEPLQVVDVHVGGDVHRVVLDGVSQLPGKSVYEQMRYLQKEADGLRRFLLDEPRGGHPALYADLVVQSDLEETEAGLIILEEAGYPLFSGTNFISTVIALMEAGRIEMTEGTRRFKLEAPGGLVEVSTQCSQGRVNSVTYESDKPAYLDSQDQVVEVPGWGRVCFDMSWGGIFYSVIDASTHGFALVREEATRLAAFAHAFVEQARKTVHPMHPVLGDTGTLSFVLFAGPVGRGEDGCLERRIAPYVHPGLSVCRSPAGTGTTAAIAQLYARNKMAVGDTLRAISPFDTSLVGTLRSRAKTGSFDGINVAITGQGWTIARSQLIVDPTDPMLPSHGFENIIKQTR